MVKGTFLKFGAEIGLGSSWAMFLLVFSFDEEGPPVDMGYKMHARGVKEAKMRPEARLDKQVARMETNRYTVYFLIIPPVTKGLPINMPQHIFSH